MVKSRPPALPQVTHDDKNWVDKTIQDMCRDSFASDLVKQVEEPLYFVDFLREPVVDAETGEWISRSYCSNMCMA